MDAEEFESYYQAIDCLEAQEDLRAFNASMAPNLKQDSRQKLVQQLQKRAKPPTENTEQKKTGKELAESINRFMHGQ